MACRFCFSRLIVVSVSVTGFTGFICLLTKAELMGTEDISITCKICEIRVKVRLRTNRSDRERTKHDRVRSL